MNKYFKYNNEFESDALYYVALDEDLYCLQAIYETKEKLINTSLSVNDPGFFLPEGSFKDAIEHITAIEEAEFTNKWNQSIAPYLKTWHILKQERSIGEQISAEIICSYPQGIILNIGQSFLGIADYNACKNVWGVDQIYPKNIFSLNIIGFDDVNMWVKLQP